MSVDPDPFGCAGSFQVLLWGVGTSFDSKKQKNQKDYRSDHKKRISANLHF
jgi:hypothetical protein